MIRLRSLVPLAALLFVAAPLAAAPRPDERSDGPAVVGQARSLHDLVEMVKTTVRNLGGDEMYKVFEKQALPEIDPGKLPGIDARRPFGLYGTLDADLTKCRGVLLIPVPGERAFVDMLDRFDIKLTKGKEAGTYDVVVPPEVPFPVAVRIHKGYAYVAVGGFDVLDPKVILDPKDVINEKEKAAAYVALRPDRMSPETKRFLHAAFLEYSDQLKEQIPIPELRDGYHFVQRLGARWLRMVLDEGKEVAFRLDADTKTGEVFVELSVEGQPRSGLALAIARRQPTRNAFAGLTGDDYAQRIMVSAPLFADEVRDAAVKLIEYGQKEAVTAAAGSPPEAITLIEAAFKSLKATVESGDLDLAAALRGPNKDGFYSAVGAVHCKEGASLEKAIRAAIKLVPERERGYFKFDAHKIGDVAVHEIDLSAEAEQPAKKIFGDGQRAYFTFTRDAVYASYGPDGMKLLKEALAAKPGPAAALDTASDGKKIADVMKKIMPAPNPNVGPVIRTGWFESMTTSARLSVEGGERLKVRFGYNVGAMLMIGFGVYAAEAGPVPPPVAVPVKD